MKKKRVNRLLLRCFIGIILMGSVSLVSKAAFMEPGSEEDPVVTLSYVEKRLEQMKYYINQSLEAINNNTTDSSESTTEKFQVVFIDEGKMLYPGESTEIIWRSGKASVIASQSGGLSDLTIGKDLQTGEEVPLNHLILVPRNDGRGMKTMTSSYVMIKGEYTIK